MYDVKTIAEKLICGHLVPGGGKIKLFGKSYKDAAIGAVSNVVLKKSSLVG